QVGESGETATRSHWYAAAVTGFSLFLIGNGGVVWAESMVPSGLAALLVAIEPSWVVILNWLRPGGVRPSGKILAGLVIGLAGVYFLIGGGSAGGPGINLLGAAIVIGAAFSWAAGSLYSKHAPLPASPLLSSGMQMLCGGGLLMLTSLLTGEWRDFAWSAVSMRSAGALIYLIIFGSIVAFTAYSWLLRVASPVQAASYAYVNPVVAVILGWALGGESVGMRVLIAAAVIVASVVLITTQERAVKS
ncbi:MAG TPA: EamA family transporter, partial [Blastocatellia bacterium]|nr:EamA family transporter [Blastocatellia bacterium]